MTVSSPLESLRRILNFLWKKKKVHSGSNPGVTNSFYFIFFLCHFLGQFLKKMTMHLIKIYGSVQEF